MMLTTLALNDHFNKLKDGKLPFEAKVAEYSEIEKLISNISKDELNHSWDGLNDISDVFIRDMAAESISIVKHTLSILTDLLDLKVDVFKNKRAIFKQLTTIIEINSNLSSNGDVTCAALQCMRLLSDVNAELRKEFLPLIQPCLLQCLKSPIDQPLKLQVLLNLKLLLDSKLCDFKKSSNTWLECLTPCLFDENANVREAAMSAFNVFKTCLTGKEEYFNTLTVNLIPVKYSKILIELIQTDKDWASIWRLMVEILGKRLHSSSVLVNALLAVEEKAFKTSNIETKKEAFICWKSLVLNFALEHSVLASERRVKLITIPLRANNCRHGEIARVKLDVWWFVVRLLRSDVAKFQETVLHPLLKFCFGPFSDAGNSLNGQSMLSNAVSGEAIIRTYPLMREPCLHALTEILSKSACLPIPPSISKDMWLSPLLEPPLVTQADFVQSARMLTQCIGESVLSIGADLDKLPWLLHAWKSLLVLINQGIEEIVNLNVTESNAKDFKCVAMVKDAFRLLVNLVESILTVPEGKPIGHVVLLMIDCMVMGETALPESILNSHTYAVGSFPVMNGTPAMILAMLLFSPAILHSKTSHKRYHAVFSKLLNLGLNGLLPPLPFAKALLKKFESNLNSELFLPHLQPQLQELWVMIVNNLSGVMENHGSLSDGSDTSYDFQCIYGLLIIPISHFLNNDPTRESIKPLLKPWKKMFELFVINAQLVINTKSSVVIEELCKKIVNVLKRANVTSNYMDHFIQFLMIIYNVSFYESYWKDFKSPAGHSFKGENLKLFHCSQQLLIVSFYKITDLMPIAIDNSECLDKHTNIISFLFLLFSTAVRYNFLNFVVEKGTICIDYYLKVLVENPELNANLEKEVVKLLDKFLEFLDKKIFSAKGNLQSNMDSISSLLEKSFQHPSLKILEVTKYYWNGSLGQNCTKKTNIPKSLSDVLDSALKDTSGSQDGMLKLMTSVVKEPYKSPNILRKSNHNDKVSTKGKVLEEKDEDFKVIPTRAKIPILTEHQKEMMKVRRVDIPALYQDLTQDSASQFFSADTPPISTGAPSFMVPDLAEDANLPFFNDNGSPMTGKDAKIKQLSSSLESKAEEVGSETKTLTSQPGQKVDSDDIPLSERLAKEPAFAFPSENSEKTPPLQDVRPRRMKRQSLVDNVPTKESDSNKSEDLNRENDKSVLYVKEKSSITIKQKEGPDSIKDEPLTKNRTSSGPTKRVSTSLKCRDVQVAHDVSDSNQPTPKKSTADVVALSKSISPSILEKTSCPETSVEVSDASSVNQKSKEVIAINAAKPSKDEGKLPVVESPASIDKTCVSKKLNSSDVVSSPSSDSTLSSEASGVGSNSSLTSPNLGNMRRKVLKRCLTKGQPEANLLQLKDSAKENESPSASPDAAVTKRKRGRPRKNVGNIVDDSPSTSSNAERSKRKVVESVSGNPEQIVDQVSSVSLTEDVTGKPECKEVEDIAKKIKLEKDFCSSDIVACVGENVSANIEGESKSKFVGGSPRKKKDSIQENSLDRGKDDKKELVLKQEAVSPRHSTILESPKKNAIPGSPKSKLSLGSPKSKQQMSSPRSKQSPSGYMSSPSLDKWVIVTKRESTEKKEVKKNDEHSSTKVPCNVVPIGKDTKKIVEAEGCNSEDLVDSSQDQNDLLNSSMTRKCSVSLSRMGEIFSNEVAFIPYEGKLLKCNLSPSKDISSKAESEVRKTLLSGSTASTNLFPSPRSISGRGARLLTLAQGNKERDSIEDRTADSPSKEADSNSSVCNMEGSPLSHKIPEFGNSTPPTKKPRRIRPMPIGNVSPQFRSLEIGCVVSDGDITIHSYSPNASPSGSVIKKRKAAPESGEDSLLPISPSSSSKKARRVSFADPIVSKHVEFCIPESERKFKKLGVNRCLRLPSDYFPSDEVQLHEESNSHSDNSSPESSSETGSNENLTQSEITTVCPESEKSKDSMKMDINEGSTTIQAKELVEKSSLAEKVEKQLAATLPNLENPKAAIGDKSGTDVTQFPSMEFSDSEFEKEQSVSADTKEEEDAFAQKDELKSLNKENMELSEKVLPFVSLEKEISSIEREFRDEVLPIIESEDKDEMEESVSLSHVSNEDCVATKDDEEGAMDTSDRGGQLRIHTHDSKKEVFPPLRDCAKPINKILSKLTSRSWRDRCKAALDKKGITTIGGLSRLTEEDLEGIPFRVNKWNNLTEELKAYKLLLDEETAEICQNVVPRSTEKQDCNDIMNMKMFREVLSKLSTQEIVKELGYANMSEEVNRELSVIIKSNNCDVTSNLPSLPSKDHCAKEQDESNKTGPSYDFKEIPESVLCSKLKPLSMLNFLADRSDIKDIAREIPLEKIMSLLKNLSAAAAASKKESLSDDCSIDETIKDIVQCVLSEVTNDKECVGDSVKLLVWFCKRVLSSEEGMEVISSLLNEMDSSCVSEIILKKEDMLQLLENRLSPSKVLTMAINSLSQCDLSTLTSSDLNKLSDVLDKGRTNEEFVDIFASKMKERLLMNINPAV